MKKSTAWLGTLIALLSMSILYNYAVDKDIWGLILLSCFGLVVYSIALIILIIDYFQVRKKVKPKKEYYKKTK